LVDLQSSNLSFETFMMFQYRCSYKYLLLPLNRGWLSWYLGTWSGVWKLLPI